MDMRLSSLALATVVALMSGCHDRTVDIDETPIAIVSDVRGRGRVADEGRVVNIDYEVKLPSGKVVMKHKDWTFVVGAGSVVLGMDEGIRGMRPGGRRVIKCPPHKHWGRPGFDDGKIPPNTPLFFHIKLNRVE